MSNIVRYRNPNPVKSDVKKFGGRVSKSEFKRRTEFISKRIALGYSAEAVAFLIGRHPGLIHRYERMAAGIRPENADIEPLSAAMGEDVSALFPPEGEDVLRWDVSGTMQVKKGITYYEITLDMYEKRKPVFKAKEKLLSAYTDKDYHDDMLATIVLQRMIHGNYFLSSKSALEIFTSLHKALVPKIPPIILKHAMSHMILQRQLCCFRNDQGQVRYHKVVSSKYAS